VAAPPRKYARIERERRFLLAALPPEAERAARWEQLEDLYFTGTTLRLRLVRAPDGSVRERKLSQKLPGPDGAAHARIITSVYLDAAEHALLSRLPGARLAKRRHRLAWDGHELGIDVFLGVLDGLVLMEVEAESEPALRAFAPPPFARREVTDDALFRGGSLATADPAAALSRARELLEGA